MTNDSINFELELQNPNDFQHLPTLAEVNTWCVAAIQNEALERRFNTQLSVLIRVVDADESANLNQEYRQKKGATNVLSFPNDLSDLISKSQELSESAELSLENSHLGDLVICDSLVRKEAIEQNKTLLSHWAHLTIHGVLHLQGFDHVSEVEAHEMESLEIKILEQLGFANPYIK